MTMSSFYFAMVYFGPKFMESRKAMRLNKCVILYNIACVFLSCYMLFEFLATSIFRPEWNWVCQEIGSEDDEMNFRVNFFFNN